MQRQDKKCLGACGIDSEVDVENKTVKITGDLYVAQMELTDAGYMVTGYKLLEQ